MKRLVTFAFPILMVGCTTADTTIGFQALNFATTTPDTER